MSQSDAEADENKNQSDSLSIFCREVRNLLRSKPNCMIPFSKFVPAYHNHYGRQCCVYQFGYTKLIELLESISHVVQILGDGTNRYITLTHREQIKRFASDLIKVVKSQPGKKLKLSQFAAAYEQVLGRAFAVEDYGTNNINVLLAEIWEGTINIMPIKREFCDQELALRGPLFVSAGGANSTLSVSPQPPPLTTTTTGAPLRADSSGSNSRRQRLICTPESGCSSTSSASVLSQLVAACEPISKPYITDQYPDAWFEIPKRERSDKEIKRTKYFVWDVIELLTNMEPEHSVPFSKFIPSYHYYFNRQCKVSIFGFSKLIDLLESISPDVVEIVDQGPGEEKVIRLAEQYVPRGRSRYKARHQNQNHHHHHQSQHQSHHQMAVSARSSLLAATKFKEPISAVAKTAAASLIGKSAALGRPRSFSPTSASSTCSERSVSSSSDRQIIDEDDNEEAEEEEEEDDDDDNQDDGVESGPSSSSSLDYLTVNNHNNSNDGDDEGEGDADDLILPLQAIDSGPTDEELLELEDELQAYEELRAIQGRRSLRMAAILDIFKQSVY